MIYIYTNGVLLSHRYIVNENGTPITRSDVSSVTRKVYTLVYNKLSGEYTSTLVNTTSLTGNDVITDQVKYDEENRPYNFRYCTEGVFTLSNTIYRVVYELTMTDGHLLIVTAKGETRDV